MNKVTNLWIQQHADIATDEVLSLIADFDLDIHLLSCETIQQIQRDIEQIRSESNTNWLFDENTHRYKNLREMRSMYLGDIVENNPIIFPDDII